MEKCVALWWWTLSYVQWKTVVFEASSFFFDVEFVRTVSEAESRELVSQEASQEHANDCQFQWRSKLAGRIMIPSLFKERTVFIESSPVS